MTSSLQILYEDNHLLILNKPAGILTQPSGTDQESMESLAKLWLKETYHKPGNVFLEAVHRLDKPVSGVVVFCKTSKSLSRLNASMRARQLKKVYWALVDGNGIPNEGLLEHYLVHDDYLARVVPKAHPEGKLARLRYRVLERKIQNTLVEIELETGRYHQIRVQFSEIGFPICGDKKYGSNQIYLEDAIALHHKRLTIEHPVSKELLMIEAPPPWQA